MDTGPLIALFDPRDDHHEGCRARLSELETELVTTAPVLTEAFHILTPTSQGARALREFCRKGGLSVATVDEPALPRAFEIMDRYDDQPADFADATLVATAEELETTRIFTVDRGDFETYRIRLGHEWKPFDLVTPSSDD